LRVTDISAEPPAGASTRPRPNRTCTAAAGETSILLTDLRSSHEDIEAHRQHAWS
jgi:hypothetical protein